MIITLNGTVGSIWLLWTINSNVDNDLEVPAYITNWPDLFHRFSLPIPISDSFSEELIIFEFDMNQIIEQKKGELVDICRFLKIKRMDVFGSSVSGLFNKDSDIDFLISFADGLSIKQYTENYFTLQYKLRELFDREVDIVTEKSLSNPYFIDSINKTKALIYEAWG